MANRRIEMFEYRHVIHNMRQGLSDRAIAKAGRVGRAKCAFIRSIAEEQGWLMDGALPEEGQIAAIVRERMRPRPVQVSISEPYDEHIRRWVEQGVQGTTIYQALVDQFGFTGSYWSVRRRVRKLRSTDPKTTCMLSFAPGEAAQVDFGKGPLITDVRSGKVIRSWIFVMTLCYSRHMYAEIVGDQRLETWLGCHRRAFSFFVGVPKKIILDNLKSAIAKACYTDPLVQRSYAELAEGYGFVISPCPVRDPKKKGRVESGVKYVKNNFVPLRTFRSLTDANQQLMRWNMEHAAVRIHGTTYRKPFEVYTETEKALLQPLPDVPVEIGLWTKVKVQSNGHVQFEKAYYSVPFDLVQQELLLKATDSLVKLYRDFQLVATHPRLREAGAQSTVDDHLPPQARAYKEHDPQWCLEQAERIGPHCLEVVRRLLEDTIVDRLRAAQCVVGLEAKVGADRLEAACRRALHFNTTAYRMIKSILHQGLDRKPIEDSPHVVEFPSAYRGGGRFLRHPLHHQGGRP